MKTSDTEITKYVPGVHCIECRGWGYTTATSTEVRSGRNGIYTHKQGSGCAKCGGTGLLEDVKARAAA